MNHFFEGFEKAAEANGLIGSMPNLASGLKTKTNGVVKPIAPPKPSIVQAPRSDMPHLGTMVKHDPKHNLSATLPSPEVPKVSVPKARRKGL